MPLGPCPRLRFNVLSIDYVRVTNCFYDYDYDQKKKLYWTQRVNNDGDSPTKLWLSLNNGTQFQRYHRSSDVLQRATTSRIFCCF